jgi:hypothetical protein
MRLTISWPSWLQHQHTSLLMGGSSTLWIVFSLPLMTISSYWQYQTLEWEMLRCFFMVPKVCKGYNLFLCPCSVVGGNALWNLCIQVLVREGSWNSIWPHAWKHFNFSLILIVLLVPKSVHSTEVCLNMPNKNSVNPAIFLCNYKNSICFYSLLHVAI